jgi:hypothetical protein
MTRIRLGASASLLVVVGLAPAGAHAQRPVVSAEPLFTAGTWMLTVEAGGSAFTDFQRALAQPTGAGTGAGMPDFRRRVSAHTTATLGANVTRWVGNVWGVRAAASWAPTRFTVWNEDDAQRTFDELNGYESADYARLNAWTAGAAIVFRLPFALGRVVPYGIAGGGIVRYDRADDADVPPEARRRFDDGGWSGAAAFFGVGSAIPLQRNNLMLNFELTNHLSRTPLDDEGLGEAFEISGVPLRLAADPARGGDGIDLANKIRLTVGLTAALRGGEAGEVRRER